MANQATTTIGSVTYGLNAKKETPRIKDHSVIYSKMSPILYAKIIIMNKTTLHKTILVVLTLGVVALSGWFIWIHTRTPKLSVNAALQDIGNTIALNHFNYIEVIDGCGPYYDVTPCVDVRSGPGTEYDVVARLRTGMVLKVESTTIPDDMPAENGRTWYKVTFDEGLLYPERITTDWYVAVDPESIRPFEDDSASALTAAQQTAGAGAAVPQTTKRIVVDRAKEMLYAYDGDTLFMQDPISTGLDATPTPRGTFEVYKKTPSRYMQGPIPGVSDQAYDLPGVPWDLYFTEQGAVIHGAYWHNHFGEPWSHGCVNLPPQEAKKLYDWAPLGTPVTVED